MLAGAWPALGQPAAPVLPAAAAEGLAALRLAGEGRLTWWGFAAYDARLWLAPQATQRTFTAGPLALQLSYLRAFTSRDIARVSLEHMKYAGAIDPALEAKWTAQLRAVIPDIAPGDRLLGVHRPGRGAAFFHNGKPAGEIDDVEFSRRFFAIWLGAATSEPGLRAALFGATPP
jgi:hypothetical protein